jgi:hypothetical protein
MMELMPPACFSMRSATLVSRVSFVAQAVSTQSQRNFRAQAFEV